MRKRMATLTMVILMLRKVSQAAASAFSAVVAVVGVINPRSSRWRISRMVLTE